MDRVGPADEGRRRPGPDPRWSESHRIEAWAGDGSLGLFWAVTARPAQGRAGFLAAVLRPDHPPVVLAEHDGTVAPGRWELRASGLWADHVCEAPLEHWSYGLEAFALVVDDPAELLGRGVGVRCPLGWELEFEAAAPARPEGPGAYRQDGVVHGVLLLGPDQHEVELAARRWHRWGVSPPAPAAAPAPGAVALPEPGGCWWLALGPRGLEAGHQPGPQVRASGRAWPGS